MDVVRYGWAVVLALLANVDKTVPTVNSKLSVSEETLYLYLGQPGRLAVQFRKLEGLISQTPISHGML